MERVLCFALAATCFAVVPFGASPASGAEDTVVYEADFTTGQSHGWQPANNLEPFEFDQGYLSTKATGHDAHMMAGGLSVPTDRVSHMTFRMRSDKPGSNQVYFSTTDSPDPAAHPVRSVHCPGDSKWHELAVQLSGLDGFSGTLTMLRLDPVNGGGEQANIDVAWIRLIRKAPAIVCSRFSVDSDGLELGQTATVTLELMNLGGPVEGDLEGSIGRDPCVAIDSPKTELRWPEGSDTASMDWAVTGAQAGIANLVATVRYRDEVVAKVNTLLLVGRVDYALTGDEPSLATHVIRGGDTSITLIGNAIPAVGEQTYSVGVLWRNADNGPRVAAVLSPLAEIAYRKDGTEYRYQLGLRLVGPHTLHAQPDGGCFRLEMRPTDIDGHEGGGFTADWTFDDPAGPVRRISGPVMRIGASAGGATKSAAVFPGVEFLGENERSSDVEVVGETCGYRPSPPAHWITVPLMAVLADDALTGMMWPAPTHGRPQLAAEFASPNFLDNQQNHLLACFLPAGRARRANQPIAAEPVQADRFSARAVIYSVTEADIVDAVPIWYSRYGIPSAAPLPHSPEEALDICIQGWAQTLWFPEERGFNNHWHVGQEPYWDGGLAANILAHSMRTGDKRWTENLAIEPDTTLLDLAGSMFEDFERPPPPDNVERQIDGLWPYEPRAGVAERAKDFTNGKRDNLGEAGSFNVGVAANEAIRLLSHAQSWGDETSLEAGIKALEAMEQFRIPRGCQGWEVHIKIPDIYAAARIISCYRLGYELTENPRWLERARYWAYTGLPFLYAWDMQDGGANASIHIPWPEDTIVGAEKAFADPAAHDPTPWASIPVLGTSFYRVRWFGNPVQWCGLCWAGSVFGLLEHMEDPLLRAAAEGVVHSGIHQTLDKEPYVGLLPDTWHLHSNVAHPAYIGPVRLESPLRAMLDRPAFGRRTTKVALNKAEAGPAHVHLTSYAKLEGVKLSGAVLTWIQQFPPGQVCETAIVSPREPKQVLVGDRPLPRTDDILQATEGWAQVAGGDATALRIKHSRQCHDLTVRF